jgi:hypothetical protein
MDEFETGYEPFEDDLMAFREKELDEDEAAGEYELDFQPSRCPACGDWIDYCQGHGEIGDPYGFEILERHDAGDHSECHPAGCDEAPQ